MCELNVKLLERNRHAQSSGPSSEGIDTCRQLATSHHKPPIITTCSIFGLVRAGLHHRTGFLLLLQPRIKRLGVAKVFGIAGGNTIAMPDSQGIN